MKRVIVLLDGLGDLPCLELKNQTPLEYAITPNLDKMAKEGKLGYMYSINEDYAPESDTAIVSIFGNNPILSSRGQLEALGLGIKLRRGDLALRANFATIDDLKSRKLRDRRAGRTLTSKEAKILTKEINRKVKLPVKFIFFNTIQHRGVLVLKGGYSDNITNIDVYQHLKGKVRLKERLDWSVALDDEENTEYTANLVNSFVDQSYKILNNHPINEEKRKKGLLPANIILARDPGIEIPKLKKFHKTMAVVNMPLEIGIARASGMDVFKCRYPTMREIDVYKNLYKGLNILLKYARKVLKRKGKKYNTAYIHIKETDVPGHDNKPHEKARMIETIDQNFFGFLKEYADKYKVRILITADHSTPCKVKTHTSDPVPFLLYDPKQKGNNSARFTERASKRGKFGKIYGKSLMKRVGFVG